MPHNDDDCYAREHFEVRRYLYELVEIVSLLQMRVVTQFQKYFVKKCGILQESHISHQ